MSILGSIVDAIFGGPAKAETPPPKVAPAPGTAGSKTSGMPQPGTAGSKTSGTPQPAEVKVAVNAPTSSQAPAQSPGGVVDVAAQMDKAQAASKEKGLDWRRSIVDVMKLLDLDSSLKARKELAKELNYTGDMKNSSEMNQWLHKQVMIKLAENGGKVPAELKD
jgi:hypothetical protein